MGKGAYQMESGITHDCSQRSFLVLLGDDNVVPGIRLLSSMCKANIFYPWTFSGPKYMSFSCNSFPEGIFKKCILTTT